MSNWENDLNINSVREIRTRTCVYFGCGAIQKINDIAKIYSERGIDKVIVMSGRNAYKSTGAWSVVEKALQENNIDYINYDKDTPNPTTDSIDEAAKMAIEFGAKAVITIGGGSSDTNNAVSAEKQRVMQFEYLSPCREFKVTIYLTNGGRYMIHYYSAVLWMAYVGPDRLAYITRPFPLYPQLADEKKVGKVWTMLNGLETHIFPSTNNSCRTSIKCRPKLYSQIKAIEIHNPCDELLKSAKDLFHFVYEAQNKRNSN